MTFLCVGFENSYIVQVRFDIRRTLIFVVIGPMCPSISCCELCDIVLLSSAKETFKNHNRKNINKTHYMLIINGMLKKNDRLRGCLPILVPGGTSGRRRVTSVHFALRSIRLLQKVVIIEQRSVAWLLPPLQPRRAQTYIGVHVKGQHAYSGEGIRDTVTRTEIIKRLAKG